MAKDCPKGPVFISGGCLRKLIKYMYCEVNMVPVQIDYRSTRGSQGKPTDSYIVCSGSYYILETDFTWSGVKTVLTVSLCMF